MEQKAFLRSFVKCIVVNHPEIKIEYTLPFSREGTDPFTDEVLPMIKTGSPYMTGSELLRIIWNWI